MFNFGVDEALLKNEKFLHHIVSPCAIVPCKNGGTCQPIAGDDFTCQCTEGFYGDNCEKGKYMVTRILMLLYIIDRKMMKNDNSKRPKIHW